MTPYRQPEWITRPLTPADLAAILQGGCASGAYMPAVTYHDAIATMSEHGDEILEWIEDYGEWPEIPPGCSWAGLACLFLSYAVELFASLHSDRADWNDDQPIGDDCRVCRMDPAVCDECGRCDDCCCDESCSHCDGCPGRARREGE